MFRLCCCYWYCFIMQNYLQTFGNVTDYLLTIKYKVKEFVYYSETPFSRDTSIKIYATLLLNNRKHVNNPSGDLNLRLLAPKTDAITIRPGRRFLVYMRACMKGIHVIIIHDHEGRHSNRTVCPAFHQRKKPSIKCV